MATTAELDAPPNYAGKGFLAEYWTLFIIALAFTVLRVYVSLRITRIFDWSDVFLYVSMVFLVTAAACATLQVENGLGQHIQYVEFDRTLQLRKWTAYAQIMIVLTTLFTKYSIGFFILRIRYDKRVKVFIFIILLLVTLATIAPVVVEIITCIPLRALWDPNVPGKCLPLSTIDDVSYAQSACTIVADLAFTISPMVILWNVRISRGRKTLIVSLMSLGLIATVANALRNVFVGSLTSTDFTYNEIWISILSPLETCSANIAACIPACAPIITRRSRRYQSSSSGINSTGRMLPLKGTSESVASSEPAYKSTVGNSIDQIDEEPFSG